MSEDVFTGNDPTPAKFDDLVGDGKRYKTNDDAAKALVEKDQFIEQLKRENAEAREAISKRINEEDFLKKLEEVARPKSPDRQEPPVDRDEQAALAPAIKPEDIEKIIEAREVKRSREANLSSVTLKLQETYGDDFKSRVQTQAKALNMSTAALTNLAAENPQAFYRLMGLDRTPRQEDSFSPPPRTSVTTSGVPMTGKEDWGHYQKLRREKGESWYFSVPVQQKLWTLQKEAEARGESFAPL